MKGAGVFGKRVQRKLLFFHLFEISPLRNINNSSPAVNLADEFINLRPLLKVKCEIALQ